MITYDAGYFKTTTGKRYKYREDAIYAQNEEFFKRVKTIGKQTNGYWYVKADTSDETRNITHFLYRGNVPASLIYLCFNNNGTLSSEDIVRMSITDNVARRKYDMEYYLKQAEALKKLMEQDDELLKSFTLKKELT